ncbi:hypothetical protein H0G86_002973 [Trichoderma simmonsii]|uniref:Uncharacterized protein n=1 Tax=Trichoderma simmonsii TaxID=1491479 RepID=A0A8G0L6S9_9HYPO|nr:hypothetical protein H0G86_002973 [Trichoderma simmonsii]
MSQLFTKSSLFHSHPPHMAERKQRDRRRDNKIRPSRCMPPPHLPDNNAENTHGPSQRPPPQGPTTQEPVVFGDFARKSFSLVCWRAYVRALLTVFFLALLENIPQWAV